MTSAHGEEPEEMANIPRMGIPLNLRRLMKRHMQLIAEILGLLSKEKLHQQIEGKLLQMEHEPGIFQVTVEEMTKVELLLSLEDEMGVFQTCGPTSYLVKGAGWEEEEVEHLRSYMEDELDSLRRMG